MTDAEWRALRYFKAEEFNEPERMSSVLLKKLDEARDRAGVPFKITSSFRYTDEGSAHEEGYAVDISCDQSRERYLILKALLDVGFRRIGVYDRHLHADVSPTHHQNVCWWDKSK